MAKRMTSFQVGEADWRMMEQLVSRHKETGEGAFASKQQVLEEAMDLIRPALVREYRRVFGTNPPSGD